MAVSIPILRTAFAYRGNAAMTFLDAVGLAMVATGFVGFGLWVAATAWIDSRTTIRDGVLRCGFTHAHRLADFRDAQAAPYGGRFGRGRGSPMTRIVLAGRDGSRVICDTFLHPRDPATNELLSAVRARLGR